MKVYNYVIIRPSSESFFLIVFRTAVPVNVLQLTFLILFVHNTRLYLLIFCVKLLGQ